MQRNKVTAAARDIGLFVLILSLAVIVCLALSGLHNDNNPFAVPIFILAVALISRYTSGRIYGVAASVFSLFCVNYMFTYPFWAFDLTGAGYPLTFAAMLLVSVIISTLTAQMKRQEQIRIEVERERMHANLLRSVSHDIRTPLSSILGASSALLENRELPQASRDDLLREINKDARWLVRLTENILSVTKFSSGDVTLKKSDEVVEEIVGSAIVKFRKSDSSIPIVVSKPDEILLAPMDATLIEQVLINLFENVAEHARTATRILLQIQCKNGQVQFSVEDDGDGIPPNVLPHIFDGYLPISADGHTDSHRNMGIGLSVCHSIIRAHGGDMTAYNNGRRGAVIHFWLPSEEESVE